MPNRLFLIATLLGAAGTALAHDCRVGELAVNPDNGATYAGLTGLMQCYDAGKLVREEELRDGEPIGLDRGYDLWGNKHERTVNADGNTEGRKREWYPDGTLKSDARYEDGDVVGLAQSFHANGALERASFHAAPGAQASARVEYDDAGKLVGFTCGDRAYLERDGALCGFDGVPVTTELFRNRRVAARVTYARGKLLREEAVDERGNLIASRDVAGDGVAAGSRTPPTDRRKTFHPNGRPATELEVADGYPVRERSWYMNGRLKTDVTREPKEREARVVEKRYRDDGTPESESIAIDRTRVFVATYDARGRKAESRDYTREGTLARKRTYSAGGAIASDERYYPDGSRRTD